MAMIEVKGYVNKPSAKKAGSGKEFSVFTLAERQKGRGGDYHKVFYNVVDFEHPEPPKESSFVTLKGYLNVSKVEKDGKTFTNLDITATTIDIAPPRGDDGGTKDGAPATKPEDDFDF